MTSRHLERFVAYLIVAIGMTVSRGAYLGSVIYNIDEAEYAVGADALDHGWLPGLDLVGSTKPPGIALLYNLLFHTFGRSMSVIHVAHLGIMIVAGIFVIEIAALFWGFSAMIPAALLFWMTANSFSLPEEILALNVESPGILCAMAVLFLLLKKSAQPTVVFVAGVGLGLAILFRQSFVFFLAPAFALISGSRPRWRSWLFLTLGALSIWLPVTAIYILHGGLGWAIDSWIRYPLEYSSDIGMVGFFDALRLNTLEFVRQDMPAVLLAIVGLVAIWKERRSRRSLFILILLLGSLLAVASGSRFWGHYWIQLFPVLTLLGVSGWLTLAARGKVARYVVAGVVVIGAFLALRHFPLWRQWDLQAPPKGVSPFALTAEQTEKKLGALARDSTSADQTIAVWGYCPQIYYYAHRLPGVRDYLCHYVTGYSVGSFDPLMGRAPRTSGHPQAVEMFLEDLETRRPKFIFDLSDISETALPFVQYPPTLYPRIAAYIRANYYPVTVIDGAYVYRLRETSTPS